MSRRGSLPKNFFTPSRTASMRLWPPTSSTSPISAFTTRAVPMQRSHSSSVRSTIGLHSSASFARDSARSKLGRVPSGRRVRNGSVMRVESTSESSTFAFSAASFSRSRAAGSAERSRPKSFSNSCSSHSAMA